MFFEGARDRLSPVRNIVSFAAPYSCRRAWTYKTDLIAKFALRFSGWRCSGSERVTRVRDALQEGCRAYSQDAALRVMKWQVGATVQL